jgi:NNP family nitrate/nitrite transporter-like MFS transporter
LTTSIQARRRWYFLGLGTAIIATGFGLSTACMPVLFSEIADKLGLNVVQIGVVWGFGSMAAIFSIPTAGFLADRFGPRRVLAVICLLAGIFGAVRGISDSFATLTITSLLFGMVSEALPVVVIKNTSLWFYGRGLGTAQGIITTGVAGGLMVGSMLSATVLSPWLGGWQSVTFFYGAITFFLGVLWFLTVPEPARSGSPPKAPAPLTAMKHVLRRGNIWLIGMAMMVFAGSNKGTLGYLPLYLRNSGWTPAGADGTLAVLNGAGMIAAVPFTLLSDRLGLRKSVLIPGLITTTLGITLLWQITGPAVWLLAVMAGLFRDVIWAVAATMTVETEGIGPEYAGISVGLVHSVTRIGYAFAPPVGNSLASPQAGLPFVFWGGLSLIALMVFLFVRETGSIKRQPK